MDLTYLSPVTWDVVTAKYTLAESISELSLLKNGSHSSRGVLTFLASVSKKDQ